MKQRWLYCILCCILTLGAFTILPNVATAQTIEINTNVSEIYTDMPFVLSLVLKDFDDDPEPTLEGFQIDGATVNFLGMTPQVSSMVTIFNNKRTEKKEVTYVFNYQVTAHDAHTYQIPPITATQGSKKASTRPATFDVKDVKSTNNMRFELELPDRPVWVGESFDVTLRWYLRQEVQDQRFSIPMFEEMGDVFEIHESERTRSGRALTMQIGPRVISLPYTRETVMIKGVEYTLFKFRVSVTPLKAGDFTIPASKVLANLQVGTERDNWGFLRVKSQLFKAQDIERHYTIKELPMALKPEAFSNAIGENYAINVTADRTIVKVGDPVMLKIEITSDQAMDGLMLPDLNIASGLSETFFSIPNEPPVGELIQSSNGKMIKQFMLPVRIKSDRVREIPPLPFSFFNPQQGKFQTVRSQPIALSVTDVARVGANDVVGVQEPSQAEQNAAPQEKTGTAVVTPNNNDKGASILSTAAIDLGLSSPEVTLAPATVSSSLKPVRLGLYALPFALLAGLVVVRRKRQSAQKLAPQKTAIADLERAIRNAGSQNAKSSASAIANAIPGFLSAMELPRDAFHDISEELDAFAFNPRSQSDPLPDDILSRLKNRIRELTPEKFQKFLSLIILISCMLFGVFSTNTAYAQDNGDEATLEKARHIYSEALNTENRAQRIDKFQKSSILLHEIADKHPESANIQADWGNAALSAYDFGNAALAYRRAIALDPTHSRAQKNMAFIRSTLSETVATPHDNNQALSTLFFLNRSFAPATRLLLAALCFVLIF